MSNSRSRTLNLPEEVPFVPDPGRGKTEKISGKRRGFYGELRGKIFKSGRGAGKGKGSQFGRGFSRGKGGKFRQRVTVKARFQKHSGKNSAMNLRKYVHYIGREGVDKDGGPAKVFQKEGEVSRDTTLDKVKEWEADRHHWRLIISPERGEDLDLNKFAKDFVEGMEQDLGTKLEWLAAAHYDTESPHIHLLIRGKNDQGEDLVINRSYVSYGMRDLAEEIATNALGQRQEWELLHELKSGIQKERFGQIDRKLLFEVRGSLDGVVDLKSNSNLADRELRDLKIKRLKFLRNLGLARRVSPGKWELSNNMEKVLRGLSIRGDIVKTMHAKMRAGREAIFYDPREHSGVSGRVRHKGLVDELGDKTFMLVEGVDGNNYYVALSRYSEKEGAESSIGDLVSVKASGFENKPIDKVILEIAAERNGEVSSSAARSYLERTKSSSASYWKNMERRLGALERKGIVTRTGDERWDVPNDLEFRVRERSALYPKVTVTERVREKFKQRER